MLALPYTYRDVEEPDGTTLRITIPGEMGGSWFLIRADGKWVLKKEDQPNPVSELIIDADVAWKLFSKSIRPAQIKDKIWIEGDYRLGEIALSMVSVMA